MEPLHLVNEGVAVNERNKPHIFRRSPQILQLPSRHQVTQGSAPRPTHECIFGPGREQPKETTSLELGRLEILTVRQLQRALQNKILQTIRPSGLHTAFQKMASKKGVECGQAHVDYDDLRKAVRDFNLHVSDELVEPAWGSVRVDHLP